ncbi:hypothetical protein Agabi119p4_9177 [Agaricus bisporus var. burnettii]|uniref:Uncharacterized protein n=1 Tax=Agaricus bisporus var. burnettii TaxID=192524 RepID=A0A8H7C4M4_AGABI|nr:hypothetical protein Agabi119p4_9177 [Agaricus bisporus var. burnettii]
MADYRDRPYPARPSHPSSPTGSLRSFASKSSMRSKLTGAFSATKDTLKSLGSPKPKRRNFIEAGFEEIAAKEKTLMERADSEIVPTSQESEKELEELREERLALRMRKYAEDSDDDEEVAESSDEENDDAKATVVPSQTESNIWNQFPTPPAELITTPPLPSPLDASQSTYGFPTPSPALLDHPALKNVCTPPRSHEVLPDLDKTPTTPRVMQITEAEAYTLKVRAANDKDAHVVTGANMTVEEFEVNVNKSKEVVGKIVDEEIPASSPALPSEPWTFTEDQIDGFRSNLSEILNSMARITPRMVTNPEVIAKELALFVSRIINSEWAEVNVGRMSIASAIREAATYHTPIDIPPPPPAKNVTFVPTPIPDPTNAPTPMDVDASPSPARIPAALKGKGKAPPPPPIPQHPTTISPVVASPIKVRAVPKPLGQPQKTGKGKPVTSYMPYKLAVASKPSATNETRAGVTPRMPKSGSRRHAMGRDASGSNAPSASAVAAAGRARDVSGSHAPQNPPLSGKDAPGKSGASVTAERGFRSGPPPVPLHTKPGASSRSAEAKNNARAFAARVVPKSYAQAAKAPVAPTVPAPIVMEETIRWADALMKKYPGMKIEDALQAVAPVVNTPPSSNEVIVPKSKKALAAQKAAQGITGGLNQKSAQFAFSHVVQQERFGDMGKIVDAINKHLVFNKSQMRVQNGRLFKNVVHFYLNLVPSKQGFMLIRESLYKALEAELPEGDSDMPNAPQSVAHLILKGFDYYTSRYNKHPEDILTGDQVIEAMGSVDQFRGLECVRKPAVVRSRGSKDMAVAFVDVWDSKTGSHTKDLVNKVYHIRGKLIKVEYARQREFVPQCQKCWKWNHGTSRCRLSYQLCARCGQPHMTKNHTAFATCCGAARKREDWTGECKHEIKCINCKGNHTADSFKCTYKRHQNNISWHDQRRATDMAIEKEKRDNRRRTIHQARQLDDEQIIEIPSSSE